ncbi:DUF4393 domain-containing protein [Vibrio sp. 3-2(1)]|uniref:DUF4393 domain-containing protein n=1 Tax=Vibrio sp. 3-2(1) TaxID=2591016 RepID=UPI001482AD35|nr:DUF4393 domain-containing protein [Vibrio sp. 3-2(1)]NNN70678.1 DUF4393 domain-containing protein [Vibrio sp. 3-2(1)]
MGWLEDIGKSLPIEKIYDDLASGAVSEVGDLAKNTVKAARCVLAPIDYLATQQDRFQRYLQRVNDKVPEDQQVNAHPQIAGPVMDNLKFVEEESVITEMFLNLLARAIDQERVNEAHPAFANIISQLSPDEAKILYYFERKKYVLKQSSTFYPSSNTFGPRKTISNDFPVERLMYPQNYFMYLDHLHSLNLAGIWQRGNQEPTFAGGRQNGVTITSETQLTLFGELFIKACIPEDIEIYEK